MTEKKQPVKKTAKTVKTKNNTKLKTVNVNLSLPQMIQYSIKMVIPTGQFANIQPEIIVKATDPDQAHDYIAPHMNKMWKEYFMVNDRRPEVAPVVPPTPVVPVVPYVPSAGTTTQANPPVEVTQPANVTIPPPPSSNVSVIKATQAIESCMSLDALDLIKNAVEISVKISKEEKPALRNLITERFNIINADKFVQNHGG